jgi:multidrug efflux pump subunit AcrA (membrane-fusion protein)
MNKVERPPTPDSPIETPQLPPDNEPHKAAPAVKSRAGRRILGIVVLLLLAGALGIGVWRHHSLNAQVMATAEQRRDFVPSVRTAAVRASGSTMSVSWPGTTEAFAQANIYARASGYISKRNVDIGSQVKAGDLLIEITAPELDHQIAQAEGTLAQMQASLQQAKAQRDLAQVTWDRDNPLVQKGWVTAQQGDTDRLTLQARAAAVSVAQANIDIGALVQADATSGTFLFTLMQSDVLRIQLYVPQDEAFGVAPGVEAIVRVPEMPGRDFPGKVTRIADALQPGTRTLLTEIDVPNPDRVLQPGVYCTVELKIPRKTPSLIVPSEAVVFNREGLNVVVVEDGVAHIRHVNVVRDFGTTVEVNAGVKEGDQVILNPPVDLTDGRKVQIRPAPPAQLS